MQKTSYNNHYYLMMLLCWIMAFLPANRWLSIDAKLNPAIRTNAMPRWVILFLIAQVWIVYTYASVAKLYPDWLDTTVAARLMAAKSHYWLIGNLLQQEWIHWSIAYVGILFDLLIIPLLLWKKTRRFGFYCSVFFHLFNSIVFQIGIFPYMSIGFAFFFFSAKTLNKLFLPKKPLVTEAIIKVPSYKKVLIAVLVIYLVIQIGLPLRHWGFKGDVLWNEEGHRLSWRMMLRSKSGTLIVNIKDKNTGEPQRYNYKKLLTKKQQRVVTTHPDMLWQLAQRIKQIEADKGKDVAVFMNTRVNVNGGSYFPLLNKEVDIASQQWHHCKHHDWILPEPEAYHKRAK